jgi:hypothetical protein
MSADLSLSGELSVFDLIRDDLVTAARADVAAPAARPLLRRLRRALLALAAATVGVLGVSAAVAAVTGSNPLGLPWSASSPAQPAVTSAALAGPDGGWHVTGSIAGNVLCVSAQLAATPVDQGKVCASGFALAVDLVAGGPLTRSFAASDAAHDVIFGLVAATARSVRFTVGGQAIDAVLAGDSVSVPVASDAAELTPQHAALAGSLGDRVDVRAYIARLPVVAHAAVTATVTQDDGTPASAVIQSTPALNPTTP